MRQSKEGQITSIYVGAEFVVPGEFETVDALIAKRDPRQILCVDFGNRPVVSERVTGAQGNGDGTVTETVERVVRPDELPRNELAYEDEAVPDFTPATEPTHFAEESEVAFGPNVEDYHPEHGDSWKGMKVKPDITLEDVLAAQAESTDPMEAIKTEAEGESDGDEQDYNTTYAG